MHQHHGVVGKEGASLVLFDKLNDEIGEDVRPVVLLGRLQHGPVPHNTGMPETLASCTRVVPETERIKPAVRRQ